MPRRVAGRRTGIDGTRARLGGADCSGLIFLAASAAVAPSVCRAGAGTAVLADTAGINVSRGDRQAGPRRSRQRTGVASPRAGARATDAVDAIAGSALACRGTDGADWFWSATAVHAADPRVAVVVGLTRARAGVADTAEGMAVLNARRGTGPHTVAGRRPAEVVPDARRLKTLRPARIVRAATVAIAGPVVPAARGPLVGADTAWIRPSGVDRHAGAEPTGDVAGDARPPAGGVAADAVGAKARGAIAVAFAAGARQALAAAAGRVARVSRIALRCPIADVETTAGLRVAGVGRAHDRWTLPAVSEAVTNRRANNGASLTLSRPAGHPHGVPSTGTCPIAPSVEPAGGRTVDPTIRGGSGEDAGLPREADSGRPWCSAGLTPVATSFVAANTLDAVTAQAFAGARARSADRPLKATRVARHRCVRDRLNDVPTAAVRV